MANNHDKSPLGDDIAKKGTRVVTNLEEKGSRVVSQGNVDRAQPPKGPGPVAAQPTAKPKE